MIYVIRNKGWGMEEEKFINRARNITIQKQVFKN